MNAIASALGSTLFGLALACATATSPQPRGATPPFATSEEWIDLFDGDTLDGWVTRGGRYDGDARWTVEDGAITGRQNDQREGGLLYTEGFYDDFELELDVRIDHPFDSGLFLRMTPDERGVQVTIDNRHGGEFGAIYSDGFLQHNVGAWNRFEQGAWNRLRVRCVGRDPAVTVWCDGELLTDYRMERNTAGFAPSGRIGLQVHGGENVPLETKVQFKDVRVRRLAVASEPMVVAGADGARMLSHSALLAGWRPLFDGASLSGFEVVGPERGVEVVDRSIRLSGGDGELRTLGDYQDFELELDVQVGPLANSGIFLRAARDGGNPAFSGCEVQVIDDHGWQAATGHQLADWQIAGALYGSLAPGVRGLLRPAPEWNHVRIRFQGPRLRTELNGRELYDVDTTDLPVPEGEKAFPSRASIGFIGLQRHAGAVEGRETFVAYRDLFVRRL